MLTCIRLRKNSSFGKLPRWLAGSTQFVSWPARAWVSSRSNRPRSKLSWGTNLAIKSLETEACLSYLWCHGEPRLGPEDGEGELRTEARAERLQPREPARCDISHLPGGQPGRGGLASYLHTKLFSCHCFLHYNMGAKLTCPAASLAGSSW